MDNKFLEAYIHLEKLCNDIYGTQHGVSAYIEDMEGTSYYEHSKIMGWDYTYKRLKELRWMRNQYTHEGVEEYDESDIAWLNSFYEKIVNQEDPISLRYVLKVKKGNGTSGKSANQVESDEQIREAWKTVKICGYVLAIIVTGVLLGVIVANL